MLQPQSEEHFHRLWKSTNIVIAVLMFFVAVVIGFILNDLKHFTLAQNVIVFGLLGILYLVFLAILFGFHAQRGSVIEKEIIREVDRPITTEVFVDRPVVKEVMVDRPVYRDVPSYVYVTNPRRKLDIPKYAYVGSRQTMTYHKRSCRFSKLIKKKYKVVNNSPSYFTRNRFKPCKSCLKRSR